MSYTVVENNLCELTPLYRRLGKDYILKSNFLIGKGVNYSEMRNLLTYERLLSVSECLLEFSHDDILEYINKKIHEKL